MSDAMTPADIEALAVRVFACIEAGDVDEVAQVWADDVVVWHNTDQVEQSKAENLAVLTWIASGTTARSYRDVRRTIVDGGFHQQHVLHVAFADGRTHELPAALFVQVAGGKVTRIDEYIDGVSVAAMLS